MPKGGCLYVTVLIRFFLGTIATSIFMTVRVYPRGVDVLLDHEYSLSLGGQGRHISHAGYRVDGWS